MALYFYQAFSKNGKKVTGYIDAPSVAAVREQLSRTGIFPTKITLAPEGKQGFSFRRFLSRGVSTKDKIFFTKQLSVLLKSGVPLLNALDLLIEQSEGNLRSVVISLRDNIKEGKSLADGMAKYPKIFESIYVQLVRAGEASGRLETILDRLTSYFERQVELRKKVTGVLTYPLIQLGVITLVVGILLVKVVPSISDIFSSQGAQLPLATRILMVVSNVVQNYYIVLLVGLICLIALFLWWRSTAFGKRTLDAIKLKIPIVSYFTKTGTVVQFSRTFGMLIEAGVNLPEALTIVTKIVNNQILVDALNQARENIIKQGRIAEYLKQTGIFPPVAIYLINTGEQSGTLDKMLLTVAENYESDLNDYADRLSTLLDPIMLLVMAGIVGFIIMAIAIPLMSLSDIANV